jgi:hypothetical protein
MSFTRALTAIAAGVLLTGATAVVRAQAQGSQTAVSQPSVYTQAKVDVVLTRFQGDKKVSSLPFTLYTYSGGHQTSMRMGVDVPMNYGGGNISYRNVGTSIDCQLTPRNNDGMYVLTISIQDSSAFSPDADPSSKLADLNLTRPPSLRSFTFSDTLQMRDGQTLQFASATDKISGEVLKTDVTLTIVK